MKNLLIVEDDDVLRNIIIETLSPLYTIMSSAEGADAWQKITIYKPEVILLDLMLPKLNGFEILEKMRASKDPQIQATAVIIFSNLSAEDDLKKAQSLGVKAFLPKASTDMQEVVAKIREEMDKIVNM